MTSLEKRKLIAINAGVWAIAMIASFILPFIAESLSSGSAKFLQVLCFAMPLIGGMMVSTAVLDQSIPDA